MSHTLVQFQHIRVGQVFDNGFRMMKTEKVYDSLYGEINAVHLEGEYKGLLVRIPQNASVAIAD